MLHLCRTSLKDGLVWGAEFKIVFTLPNDPTADICYTGFYEREHAEFKFLRDTPSRTVITLEVY